MGLVSWVWLGPSAGSARGLHKVFEATRLDAAAAAARPASSSSSSCAFKGLQLRPRPRLLHRPAAAVFCWSCLSAVAVVVVESLKLDFKFVVFVVVVFSPLVFYVWLLQQLNTCVLMRSPPQRL